MVGMTPRFVVDDRVPPSDPEPPPGGWRKPTCTFASHKWTLEVEDGRAEVRCADPCGDPYSPTPVFDPSEPPPVCMYPWEPDDFYTVLPIPVALTYVDDSTPSTPAGPAEYGFYIEVRPA